MPVLLKQDENNPFSTVDIENLVTDVRERLCLKNQEMLYQYEYGQRYTSASFCRHDHIANEGSGLIKGSSFQNSNIEVHSKKAYKKRSSYLHVPYNKQTFFERDLKVKDKQCKFEDPQLLLQKLLSEQSLIQEAVRRLNFQKSKANFQDTCLLGTTGELHSNVRTSDDHPEELSLIL